MADSVVIECPVTPERIDQCPATPDLIFNIKSPDSSASSDTDCPLNLRTQSSDSPPPNCAICLGRCRNKCFTDSCLHQFCFKCLLEWSKVKAECPLCKQPFKSIIHNVKSIDQFEEYLVGQPQQTQPNIPPVPLPMPALTHFHHHPQPSAHSLTHHIHHRSASAAAAAAAAAAHSLYPHRFDVFLGDYTRFRSELNRFSTTVQVHPSDNDTLQQLILHRSLLADRLREQYPDETIPPGSLGQLWRRYIYDRRLYAMPVVDITGRYRECSARFFRDNPAQMHRLMGWLNRDVVCLLRDSEHHASYVLNVISELLRIFNITSPDFRRRCQHYFRQRTSHFIHEFLNFARSPFDMIGYDREVRYSPYYEEVIISSSSSSSSLSDSEDAIHMRTMNRGRSRGTAEFTIETRSNCSTFILTGTFDGQSATNIASTSRTSGIIALTDGIVQPQILGQSRIIQIGRNITLSSSSSDECEFVSELKPPHLRTPELVTLNSASDSDVVFVSERKTKTMSPASIIRQMVSSRKRKIPKGVFVSSLSTSSSSSSSSSGESNKEDEELESKKEKSPDAAASDDSKPSIDGLNKVKDEYNNGASTSSGIQSSEHKLSKSSKAYSSNSKKYYARPVRQASSKKQKNSKSIYEESSTENEADSGKSSSSVSFKIEESSDSDSKSILLSKIRMKKRRKRKHERRRTHTESSSCKKKKSKKSARKKSKRSKTVVPSSSSSSKLRNKKCKPCVSSSPSSSSFEESEAYKANGWSSSSSSD